jgi:hypothetical protein
MRPEGNGNSQQMCGWSVQRTGAPTWRASHKTVATITNPADGSLRMKARAACLVVGALFIATKADAQAYTPPPPPLTTAPCVPSKKDPCNTPAPAPPPGPPAAAEKFPFPGEQPATTTPTNTAQPGTVSPATSPAPADSSAKPTPAQQFPFPGEAPAAPASVPAKPAAPSSAASKFPFPGEAADSSSNSSSSSSDSPDNPALKDAGSSGSTRFERRKLAVPEDNNKRELEDLDVSHFYITTGDYLGAYMRAQDAVKLYPDDESAHIALAIAADKLKKKDEAIAAYKKYLAMAPDGEKAKEAHRALATLSGK